ncbi:MAG: PIN domain-containing protein [Candidatus Nanoarchaeia archaeon]
MGERYYFDTSIWLDFFEDRDEPNFPKGKWAQEIVERIIETNGKIVYSDLVLVELQVGGYSSFEVEILFKKLKSVLVFIESTERLQGKAKDLAVKRNVPKGDALHALLAREAKATLISFDGHFKELQDIVKTKKPQEKI